MIVGDDDPDRRGRIGHLVISALAGNVASIRKPPPGAAPVRSSPPAAAARSRMPGSPWPSRPGRRQADARGRAWAVVADAQPQGVVREVQFHVDRGARRVPPGVGQRFLDDAVGGQLDAGIEGGRAARKR